MGVLFCKLDSICVCVSSVCVLKRTLSLRSVLGADRVEQMTKTYNDVEVVTHLLAEVRVPSLLCSETATGGLSPGCVLVGQRDRDLELAARIGQSLLQRNHLLQERNEALEEQLAQALDQVASGVS